MHAKPRHAATTAAVILSQLGLNLYMGDPSWIVARDLDRLLRFLAFTEPITDGVTRTRKYFPGLSFGEA
jgi:hypothetical protein